jgi:hypothetical protein
VNRPGPPHVPITGRWGARGRHTGVMVPRAPTGHAGRVPEPHGRRTMHKQLEMRTSHRTRTQQWVLALLWAAGVLALALATAVWFVAVYWIEGA